MDNNHVDKINVLDNGTVMHFYCLCHGIECGGPQHIYFGHKAYCAWNSKLERCSENAAICSSIGGAVVQHKLFTGACDS